MKQQRLRTEKSIYQLYHIMCLSFGRHVCRVGILVVFKLHGDVLQIYASDHTSSIYGSSPSTPIIGSPPPLTGNAHRQEFLCHIL